MTGPKVTICPPMHAVGYGEERNGILETARHLGFAFSSYAEHKFNATEAEIASHRRFNAKKGEKRKTYVPRLELWAMAGNKRAEDDKTPLA